MIVFASDLDNTLIFSYKKKSQCKTKVICVETKDGKELSYMTEKAYTTLQKLKNITFIPVTTRSIEQYQRIRFFEKGNAEYALVANGAILLQHSKINEKWFYETKKLMQQSEKELQKAISLLQKDKNICFEIRLVDDVFVYTKSVQPQKTITYLNQNLNLNVVFTDSNGEKIYVFPNVLQKGNAIKRLRKFLNCQKIISAGDSAFDISMLQQSDVAFWSGKQNIVMKKGICYQCKQNVTEFGEKVISKIYLEYQ